MIKAKRRVTARHMLKDRSGNNYTTRCGLHVTSKTYPKTLTVWAGDVSCPECRYDHKG